jgi:hypothetical protein
VAVAGVRGTPSRVGRVTEENQRDAESSTSEPPSTNLRTWERWVAGIFGGIGAGVGGVAIFLTNNQAGTTAILLLGALFMLIAVQGTAVRKAAKDSVELERRWAIARVAETAEEVLDEDGPDSARAVIEGATAARPEIRNDPQISAVDALVYSGAVYDAIFRVMHGLEGYGQLGLSQDPTSGPSFDAAIASTAHPGNAIVIEILYAHGDRMGSDRVRRVANKIRTIRRRGLIVANKTMTKRGFESSGFGGEATDIQYVLWRDHNDDSSLALGLSRLASQVWSN